MADVEEAFKTCEECGATIYPEHLVKGMAELYQDKLLCVHCLKERRSADGQEGELMAEPVDEPAVDLGLDSVEDTPIALVDEDETSTSLGLSGGLPYEKKPTAIRSFGGGPGGLAVGEVANHEWRRDLLQGVPFATRCKTFHCKLADGPITHMNEQINEWADAQDDVQIKFATSVIGIIEGKHVDPHLIVTVFY